MRKLEPHGNSHKHTELCFFVKQLANRLQPIFSARVLNSVAQLRVVGGAKPVGLPEGVVENVLQGWCRALHQPLGAFQLAWLGELANRRLNLFIGVCARMFDKEDDT